MKKISLIANWKMNKSKAELEYYFTELEKKIESFSQISKKVHVAFSIPYPYLDAAHQLLHNKSVGLSAQNVFWQDKGAFTGEVSVLMLKELGVQSVIIGHSERRTLFHENHELLAKKVEQCLRHDLEVIFCIGETLEQRKSGQTYAILQEQLHKGLALISSLQGVLIAYEPVWAIGTGVSATVSEAQEAHAFIRGKLAEKYGKSVAEAVSILYGGSMTPQNIEKLLQEKDIDGGLVGGASLEAQSFAEMLLTAKGVIK